MAQLELDGVVTRNVEFLRDGAALAAWLPELAQRIGMKPVGEARIELYEHWPGSAPSAVQFIEESAIVVHTYPELSYIEITLHSCVPIPHWPQVAREIVESLGMEVKWWVYHAGRDWRTLAKGPTIRGPWQIRDVRAGT